MVAVPVYIPTSSAGGFPSLHNSPALVVCGFFDESPADRREVILPGSFYLHYPLEKGMATHSIILARRIPWTEEHSRL